MSNDPTKKTEADLEERLPEVPVVSEDLDSVLPSMLASGTAAEGDEEKPSHDEVAEQICKIEASDEDDDGPNDTLKRHIEMYSYYSPVFASVGYTLIGAVFIPAMLYFVIYQLSPAYELSELQGALHSGLISIVLPLLFAGAMSRALVAKGLARKHLGWSKSLCLSLIHI